MKNSRSNNKSKKIGEMPPKVKVFLIRVIFSFSFISFIGSLFSAGISIVTLLILPLLFLFGGDVASAFEESFPGLVYSLFFFALLITSIVLLIKDYKKEYTIVVAKKSDIKEKSTSSSLEIVFWILYILSFINLFVASLLSTYLYNLFDGYEVLIILYTIVSFVIFFVLGDLLFKKNKFNH